MAEQVLLYVRSIINSGTVAIRTSTDSTVAEFKLQVALHFDVPVVQQRLFRINTELRNNRTIESYGLQDGQLVYLIRRSVPDTSSASTSMAAAAATPLGGNGTPDNSSKVSSVQNQGFGGGNSASLSSGLDGDGATGSSDETVPRILINVQYSSETRFAIRVRPESTVVEFKGLITQLQNIPVNEQRLIYSGQFLQDDKTIGSYGVQDGHVVHLARRLVPATSCTSARGAPPPPVGGYSTAEISTGAGSVGFEGETSSLFGSGIPGFEQLEQPMSGNPNMVIGMMTIPAIQDLLNDPHVGRVIIVNDMWILESTDPEPDVVYIFNNPGAHRQRMETIRFLEQIREMVRDRIMSNSESLPDGSEGSNMLRQRDENVHEPLLNALPNQWGGNAGANVPGFSGLGIPGLPGLDAEPSSFINPAPRIQPLQHPVPFQNIDEVIHNYPQSSRLVDSNPQVLDAMRNPEMSMSQLASHRRLQQSQAFFSSPLGSTSRGTGQTARGPAGGLTAGGAGRPEVNHAQQLSFLRELGFHDNCTNLRALIATAGNIGAAVALLLQNQLGR
ncbi:hypothetical protein POM88_012037 [Heracleum sosnowskyi]|uniref:Ubiquitin-like domain-containing protein n=1 Tax=Heracleum sosnowskyi TaxID=360622 RepID=A0AAD8IY79_9APIA|nr:hypothetical protein POM88_012037 [Heracleum sosnowskyi]